MSTAPTTPHTSWSFTHWLQGKERMLGQLRWWITIIALLALAIGGPLLSGSITPVVTDRDNQCAYNAAEDTPPVFADGVTVWPLSASLIKFRAIKTKFKSVHNHNRPRSVSCISRRR